MSDPAIPHGDDCPVCENRRELKHLAEGMEPYKASAAQAVIQAARLAVATYPMPYPGAGKSDIDFYMAKLQDALEALDE